MEKPLIFKSVAFLWSIEKRVSNVPFWDLGDQLLLFKDTRIE